MTENEAEAPVEQEERVLTDPEKKVLSLIDNLLNQPVLYENLRVDIGEGLDNTLETLANDGLITVKTGFNRRDVQVAPWDFKDGVMFTITGSGLFYLKGTRKEKDD